MSKWVWPAGDCTITLFTLFVCSMLLASLGSTEQNILGSRFMDGWLYDIRFCGVGRIRCSQGAWCSVSIPNQSRSESFANGMKCFSNYKSLIDFYGSCLLYGRCCLPVPNILLIWLISCVCVYVCINWYGANTFLQRISAMEKGQCPTVATWEGGNVRSRKATPTTATTPGQVGLFQEYFLQFIFIKLQVTANTRKN